MTYEAPAGAVEDANASLAALAPRSDRVNWLHCYFEPGDPWSPIERLMIAEVIPRATLARQREAVGVTGESLLDELEGPNPRTFARWDARRRRLVYRSGVLPPSITERQWLLFRELGGLAVPQFVVQGTCGGHVRRLNRAEVRILEAEGRSSEAPEPGDLPFARVDRRTLETLRERDRMAQWLKARAWEARTMDDVRAARKDTEKAFNRQLLRWLDSQFAEPMGEGMRGTDLSSLPAARIEDAVDWDAVDASFVDEDDFEAAAAANTPRGERTLVAL